MRRFDGKRLEKRDFAVRKEQGILSGGKNNFFQLQHKILLGCKLNVFKFSARQNLIILEQRENEILFTGLETEDLDTLVFKIETCGKGVSKGINA